MTPHDRAEPRQSRRSKYHDQLVIGSVFGKLEVAGAFFRIKIKNLRVEGGWSTEIRVPVNCLGCGKRMTATPKNLMANRTGCRLCASRSTGPISALKRFRHRMVPAFGEAPRLVKEWSKDPRCRASYSAVQYRLRQGWPLEKALTTPCLRGASKPEMRREAFGESKGITDWSRDPRSVVNLSSIRRRLNQGMSLEDALTRPPGNFKLYSAFGESKGLGEWSRDSRCLVRYDSLRERVRRGIELEVALTTPPQPGIPISKPGN